VTRRMQGKANGEIAVAVVLGETWIEPLAWSTPGPRGRLIKLLRLRFVFLPFHEDQL